MAPHASRVTSHARIAVGEGALLTSVTVADEPGLATRCGHRVHRARARPRSTRSNGRARDAACLPAPAELAAWPARCSTAWRASMA